MMPSFVKLLVCRWNALSLTITSCFSLLIQLYDGFKRSISTYWTPAVPNTMKSCEVSCCVLVAGGIGAGQGTLLRRSNYSAHTYVLLTCHHLIPSKAASRDFTVSFYDGECRKSFKLNEDNVGSCYSCCGEDGILGKHKHFNDHCPFELDFTLIELKGSDVEEKLSSIEFIHFNLSVEASNALVDGTINSLLTKHCSTCHFYGRSLKNPQQVRHVEHALFLECVSQDLKKLCVLRDWGFKVPCLNVIMDDELDVCGKGFSGAPIYVIHQNGKPLLVGIHTRSELEYSWSEDGEDGDFTTSINTNFLWILQLLKVELEDEKGLHLLPSHVLWAIFLRYEKAEFKTKDNSLLSRVAEVIWKQLYRPPEKEQLNDNDEIKMFEKIDHFFSCRKHRYEELLVTEKISKDLNDQEKYSQAIQEINSQAADTSFCSDWTNSDNDDSADAPPKRKVSNTEVVTGKEKK